MSRSLPANYQVFVSNVAAGTTQEKLRDLFKEAGQVHSIVLRENNQKTDGTQVGYVRFYNENDATTAVSKFNGYKFFDLQLYVRKVKDRNQGANRPSGDGQHNVNGTGGRQMSAIHHNINNIAPVKPTVKYPTKEDSNKDSNKKTEERLRVKAEIFVSHVETPILFWAQLIGESKALQLIEITDSLFQACASATPIKGRPASNKIYGAKYSEDDQWYRSKVISPSEDNSSLIHFIDYGNSEIVRHDRIVEIPAALAAKEPLAEKFALNDVEAKETKGENFKAGRALLQKLTEEQLVIATLYVGKEGPANCTCVDLKVNKVDIKEKMLESGFIVPRRIMSDSPGRPNSQSTPKPSILGEVPQRQDRKNVTWGANNASKDLSDSVRQELEQRVNSLNSQLKRHVSEKEKICAENTKLLKDNKTLNIELANSLSAAVTMKIKNLQRLAKNIRQLRQLYPTNVNDKDIIGQSIELTKNVAEKISHNIPAKVSEDVYNVLQKKILDLSSKDETLPNLVKERDAARSQLMDNIVEFVNSPFLRPLEKRIGELKSAIYDLTTLYKTSTPINSDLNVAVDNYKSWMESKKDKLNEIRQHSDKAHAALNDGLKNISQNLSPFVTENENASDSDIDSLISDLLVKYEEEVKIATLDQEGARVVSEVVYCLLNDHQEELTVIDRLWSMQKYYIGLRDRIQPWLTEKPNVDNVMEGRREFKGLKSKLRHSLADLEDAIEDPTKHEIENVQASIAELRSNIQRILSDEDESLMQLADLCQHHFPELRLLHPELHLEMYARHGMLCRPTFELDYFDTTTLTKKTTFKSSINTIDIVIKEYILDDSLHGLGKNDLITQAIAFNELKGVEKIIGIFFSKSDRQAYVMVPFRETLQVRMQKPILGKDLHKVLAGVLKGLTEAHKMGGVYGALHPENIYIDEEGNGILADMDFSKLAHQRACIPKLSSNGLFFNAPEARHGQEVTVFADMYSFGILILALCLPGLEVRQETNVPDLSSVDLKEPFNGMLGRLLIANPSARCSSTELLMHPYFSEKFPSPSPSPIPEEFLEDIPDIDEFEVSVEEFFEGDVEDVAVENGVEDSPEIKVENENEEQE